MCYKVILGCVVLAGCGDLGADLEVLSWNEVWMLVVLS